jgi:hypothetical protein
MDNKTLEQQIKDLDYQLSIAKSLFYGDSVTCKGLVIGDWDEGEDEYIEDEKIRDTGESIDLTRAFSNCTSLTQFPPLYLGEGTTVPINPIRDMDSYEFIKYLHEASPEELESGTITERTLSKITENRQ